MEKFTWLLTSEVAETVDKVSKRERAVLFLIFDQISRFPHASGVEIGGTGRKRPAFHQLFGRWSVLWWVDFPVKEIHILQIDRH